MKTRKHTITPERLETFVLPGVGLQHVHPAKLSTLLASSLKMAALALHLIARTPSEYDINYLARFA